MGRFVVLEGIDGAGTTTQASRLADRLRARGDTVIATAEPTDGPVGRLLRQVLRGEGGAADPAALPWLFAADRADHIARLVAPALSRGHWVVADRYLPSSLAYQSLDRGMDGVAALNDTFPLPDLTLLLRVSADAALARITSRGAPAERFERRDTLARVAAAYESAMAWVVARGGRVVTLDGEASADAVEAAVWAEIEALDAR